MALEPDTLALLEEQGRNSVAKFDGDAEDVYAELRDLIDERRLHLDEGDLWLLSGVLVLEYWARQRIDAGYLSFAAVLTDIRDAAEEFEDLAIDDEHIRTLVQSAWNAHLAEQHTWPDVTDNDRLSRAFAALDESGIVARENFTCCQQCAGEEIPDEVTPGVVPDGYVFFHSQDTENAVAGGDLLLGYGTFTYHPSTESMVAVGERVVAALRGEGLNIVWDGSPDTRIAVRMTWRQRIDEHAADDHLAAEYPPYPGR